MKKSVSVFKFALLILFAAGAAQSQTAITERDVRAHMQFLAGDALQGRGSMTEFERIAAEYFGSMMAQFGIEPAGHKEKDGRTTFIQSIPLTRVQFTENPNLKYGGFSVEHGREMVVLRMNSASVSGGLQKISAGDKVRAGAVVLIRSNGNPVPNQIIAAAIASGAAAVIVEESKQIRANWVRFGSRRPAWTTFAGANDPSSVSIAVSTSEAERLSSMPDGTLVEIAGSVGPPQKLTTWNAVGKITGSDPKRKAEVILLSAHLDHLGMRPGIPNDDKIFNGADDDASGCVAVLELGRMLAAGKKPKRTVYFAFYGSEEAGGFGSRFFVRNLEFPKDRLIANLQFEMIGRPDPKVGKDELWLTGFDRSDLGPALAKKGARIVADPHPDENFFQRSDNFTLAREGIVAHTVSSFGLHTDYHELTDEIATIDFGHMTRAINSMTKPVLWLVNSSFRPAWVEGKKP